MAGSRKGKLAVCSQSLYGNVEWLKEWVDHQFVIGADEVILHTPTVNVCHMLISWLGKAFFRKIRFSYNSKAAGLSSLHAVSYTNPQTHGRVTL